MLETWSPVLCVVRTSPGKSCASQYASSRVSTCGLRLNLFSTSLAAARSRGATQLQVRVLRIWFQSSEAAATALSCSVMALVASALRDASVVVCLSSHAR